MKQFFNTREMVVFAATTVLSSAGLAALTPPNQPAASQVPCLHGTPGWTKTKTPEWTTPETLSIFNFDLMMNNWVNNQSPDFPGQWTFQLSSDATGMVNIGLYQPRDGSDVCEHGASITMSISNLALPAGQQLQWMQLYGYNVTANSVPANYPTSGSNIVDPPIGYPGADGRPFYYDVHGGTWPIPADGHFEDGPATFPPDEAVPHSGDWSFFTLVTSWNGTFDPTGNNVVTIYGREDWGYSYLCDVPEPASIGCMMLLLTMRRRVHR